MHALEYCLAIKRIKQYNLKAQIEKDSLRLSKVSQR